MPRKLSTALRDGTPPKQDRASASYPLLRGEHIIQGFRNGHLRELMPDRSPGQVSRMLKRLRTHGLIKKIGRTYKYYVTASGRILLTTGLKLKNIVLIPELARAMAA